MGRFAVVALLLVLTGCGTAVPAGPAARTPATAADGVARIEIAYAGGAVTGGASRWAVPRGATVELVVGSDVADEVHLHGYDRTSYVTAGATTGLRFVAELPGVFVVELEQRAVSLGEIQVS